MKFKRKFPLILILTVVFISAGAEAENKSEQITIRKTMKKVREYCARLKAGAYHFVCLEEVSEKIDYSKHLIQTRVISGDYYELPSVRKTPKLKEKNEYLYDYQLIKKGARTKERRILLKKNGRKKNEKNAQLETKEFRYKHVLLGTVDLFGESSEFYNDYKIINEEVLNGEEAIVIEATPKALYTKPFRYGVEPTYLSGKTWVKKTDYSILKIQWSHKTIKGFQNIEERAMKYEAEPRITIITEYGFEKNGIRFPSRFFVEQAYISKKGKKFIRSELNVIYKDYKFFLVETEVEFK